MCNWVCHVEVGTQAEGVREQGAEEDVCAQLERGDRRLYDEELNDLYSSPNITRVIKLRRMRLAGNIARMAEKTCAYRAVQDGIDLELNCSENKLKFNFVVECEEIKLSLFGHVKQNVREQSSEARDCITMNMNRQRHTERSATRLDQV
jgi:hypothetical protein